MGRRRGAIGRGRALDGSASRHEPRNQRTERQVSNLPNASHFASRALDDPNEVSRRAERGGGHRNQYRIPGDGRAIERRGADDRERIENPRIFGVLVVELERRLEIDTPRRATEVRFLTIISSSLVSGGPVTARWSRWSSDEVAGAAVELERQAPRQVAPCKLPRDMERRQRSMMIDGCAFRMGPLKRTAADDLVANTDLRRLPVSALRSQSDTHPVVRDNRKRRARFDERHTGHTGRRARQRHHARAVALMSEQPRAGVRGGVERQDTCDVDARPRRKEPFDRVRQKPMIARTDRR